MLYVSLLVEALRARPRAMFWVAALSQAFIWVLVPALIYAAPPGEVPLVLSVRAGGDAGRPVTAAIPDSPEARAFTAIAEQLAARISIQTVGAAGA